MSDHHHTWKNPGSWDQIPPIVFIVPPSSWDGEQILRNYIKTITDCVAAALQWKLNKELGCKPGPNSAGSAGYALIGCTNDYINILNSIRSLTLIKPSVNRGDASSGGDDTADGLSRDDFYKALAYLQDNTMVEEDESSSQQQSADPATS